jgi:hypothetical protein
VLCVQSYANAALLSYTTELHKSRFGLLFNASSDASPPVLSTNASYVMCPDAVGAVSESLRRWSGGASGGASGGNASRAGGASAASSAIVSSPGPSTESGDGSRTHAHIATDNDAALLSRGDSPYMVLLARASQVHGLEHVAEGWDAAAGSDARGRGHHTRAARDAAWVEVGCRVASVRRLPFIDTARA